MLTKNKAEADKAHAALESGDSWKTVAKKYSIDDTSKAAGGKLPAQAKGTLDKELDDAVFSAKKNELEGPIKTQYGYYVFTVTAITAASQQTLAEAKETIKQTLAVPEPAEGAGHLREGLHEALEGQDGVLRGLQDHGLQERPEGHADPGGAADPTQQVPQHGAAARTRRSDRRPTPGPDAPTASRPHGNVDAKRRLRAALRR